jgi:hypothetical protein
MKARAALMAAKAEAEMTAVAKWSRWQDEVPPTKANPMGFANPIGFPLGPPTSLVEGTPPSELGIVTQSLQKMKRDIEFRQQRLLEEQFEFVPAVADTPTREEARLALGRALENAVTSGLLDEERAVAMIAAGQINNTPMTPAEALTHLRLVMAQVVASGALSTSLASEILSMVGDEVPINEDPPLLERIALLEDQVYQSLLIRPCHDTGHAELHRNQALPCATQFSWLGLTLLNQLGLPPEGLPRVAHLTEDGAREACCVNDGRVGTWLVYGQTQQPQDRYDASGGETPDASDGDD